jgi:hypothetical protein
LPRAGGLNAAFTKPIAHVIPGDEMFDYDYGGFSSTGLVERGVCAGGYRRTRG